MALYVYGLMQTEDGARAASESSEGRPALDTVVHDRLCALVSPIADGNVALRRESALAHSETVQAAFAHGPVLPARFGTIVSDAETLERELLMPRASTLRARLEALAGMAEMQVKATYLEEPLLRSILDAEPRLAAAAARIRELPAAATHFDRVALGEAIGAAVEARRVADAERLVGALEDLAIAVAMSEPVHERGVLNAAFLVTTDKLEEFDAAVELLSRENAERMQFRLIGPMPVYSFADREWEHGLTAAGSGQWA